MQSMPIIVHNVKHVEDTSGNEFNERVVSVACCSCGYYCLTEGVGMRHAFLLWVSLLLLMLTSLAHTSSAAAPLVDPPLIRLRYATFDPLTDAPSAPTLHTPLINAWQPQMWIVQFHQPVREAWQADLKSLEVQVYGSLPDYALLVRMDAATAQQVQQHPAVRWVGVFSPAYRVDPLFFSRPLDPATALDLVIATLPDANLAALIHQLETWRGEVQQVARTAFAGYLGVRIPLAYVPHIAALDGVVWVEAADVLALHQQPSTTIITADQVRANLSLTGADQVIAIADSGLDTGDLATLHRDLRGRVIRTYALGRAGDWSDPTGHGTHMAGAAAGSGVLSGSVPEGNIYAGTYTGVAPAAKLVIQSIGDAQGGIEGVPFDRGSLMRQAYSDGARIHSNSWGGHTGGLGNPPDFGRYTISSRQVDAAAWEYKDMLILYSAGNEGRDDNRDGVVDADGLTQPGTAKNALTVGASENNQPTIARYYGSSFASPIERDLFADNPNGMAAFSSRGPTDDGRVKPDIVAPGTFITAARSQDYLFSDALESSLQAYDTWERAGGAGSWQSVAQQGRNGSRAWLYSANGTFSPAASSYMLTPAFDVSGTAFFDLTFWHQYQLGNDNRAEVLLLSRSASDPSRIASSVIVLPMSGSRSGYSQVVLENLSVDALRQSGIDPTRLQLGFGIASASGNLASRWWLDDLRVDGADWGTLGKYRMTARGSDLDEAYVMLGGTSSATALTAGAAAVVREWLTTRTALDSPSAALLKGMLLNGAADISPGQYSGRTEVPAQRPNSVSGWGRLDLRNAIQPLAPRTLWFTDQTEGISTSMMYTYTFAIGTAGQVGDLDLTLTWTDYPGYETASKALVNDLDLSLITPDGRRIVGNQGLYSGGQCLRNSLWDACNNVEGVRLKNAPAGSYQVQVRGADVSQGRRQPYALVLTGTAVRPLDSTAPRQTYTIFLPAVQRR